MDLEKEYLELNLFKEIDSILQKIEQDQQNKNKIIQKPKSDQIEKNKVTHNDDYKIEKDQDINNLESIVKKEIFKNPKITYQQEIELIKRIKYYNDKKARDEFITLNLRFIYYFVKKHYYKYDEEFLDLFQVGCIGLILALEKYNFNYNNKFLSYAIWWIRQIVERYYNDNLSLIRFPENLNQKLQIIKKEKLKYFRKNNKFPTDDELSILTGYNLKNLKELQYFENIKFYSLYTKLSDLKYDDYIPMDEEFSEYDDYNNLQLQDIISIEIDNQIIEKVDSEKLINIIKDLLSELDDKEKRVIIMRYGLFNNESKTLQEIADELGYSRERIRQIELDALRSLNNSWLTYKLKDFI